MARPSTAPATSPSCIANLPEPFAPLPEPAVALAVALAPADPEGVMPLKLALVSLTRLEYSALVEPLTAKVTTVEQLKGVDVTAVVADPVHKGHPLQVERYDV